MKSDIIRTLTGTFEGHAQETEGGVEFWLARDLQNLVDYAKRDNFLHVGSKAKADCKVAKQAVLDQSADTDRMVNFGDSLLRQIARTDAA